MLELDNVSTRYGAVSMLRNVSLKMGQGQIVCLLGPNGAGKTTTFKAITGLVPLQSGAVRVMGHEVGSGRTEALAPLGVGLVPEGRRLFPELTVRENLRLGYDALVPKGRGTESFEHALDRVTSFFPRVQERLAQNAGTLSGGEQAMVALCRALIGKPRLVIMDEPTLGLSPLLIEEYFEQVARINRQGITVLLIEQNAEAALSIAHHGYLLVQGQVVASGSSAELLANDTVRHLYL